MPNKPPNKAPGRKLTNGMAKRGSQIMLSVLKSAMLAVKNRLFWTRNTNIAKTKIPKAKPTKTSPKK